MHRSCIVRRLIVFLALPAVLATVAPSSASACRWVGTPPPSPDGTVDDPLVWTTASAAALDALMLGLQLGYGAEGRLLPHAGAALEGVVAVLNLAASNVLLFAGVMEGMTSCGSAGRRDALLGVAGGTAFVGSWLLAHAIWSASVDENPPFVRPSVSVGPDGAMLTVLGAF